MSGYCIDCKHSSLGIQGMFNQPHLMCRARPPRGHVLPNPNGLQMMSLYPIVDKNGTCGLFEAGAASARLAKEDGAANEVRIVS